MRHSMYDVFLDRIVIYVRLYVGKIGEGRETTYVGYKPILIKRDTNHWDIKVIGDFRVATNNKEIVFGKLKTGDRKITWFALTDKKGVLINDYRGAFDEPCRLKKGDRPSFPIGAINIEEPIIRV